MSIEFRTTIWSVIRDAQRDPGLAHEEIVRRYYPPILGYLKSRGLQEADTEDLAQEVFTQVCREGFLARADASKGKFRTLLLVVTKNVLASYWRGRRLPGPDPLPLGAGDEEVLSRATGGAERDDVFNRLWVENLVKYAVDRLRSSETQYQATRLFYFDGKSQREIAEALGRKEKDVENDLAAARRRMRQWIADLIRDYSSSVEEYEQELSELGGYL